MATKSTPGAAREASLTRTGGRGGARSPLLNDDCVVVFEYPVELGSLPPKLGSRDQLVGLRNRRYGRTVLGFDAYKPTGKVPLDPRPAEFEGF